MSSSKLGNSSRVTDADAPTSFIIGFLYAAAVSSVDDEAFCTPVLITVPVLVTEYHRPNSPTFQL
ncbi:hypothetical protein D9757_009923 [Collybiopsis confluens]|uniref:Uncharacterized protein n=1 Tax=Collybiopsis confluens TaxID=2823264 RepID=A0A8H5GW69_9AGAR|nr:hypothetical protein D9757_009923 [Collybiopsis confluens]